MIAAEHRLTVAADADGARRAAVWVRDLVADADASAALACELAVAEAAANAVAHGGREACGFTLIVRLGSRFTAAVCNRGRPFVVSDLDMPGPEAASGRGLPLIAACMERLRVSRVNGESRLLMARRLAQEAT